MASSPVSMPDATPETLIPLTLLKPGQTALVEQIVDSGEVAHRLREMGLKDRALVEMVRVGSPCIIRINGRKLGLRADVLAGILVRLGAVSTC